jgi:hypothetical protein
MPRDSSSLSHRREVRLLATEAVTGIIDGCPDPLALETAAAATRGLPGGSIPGDIVWAYAEILSGLAMAVQWMPAMKRAESDSERFKTAAVLYSEGVLRYEDTLPKRMRVATVALSQVQNEDSILRCAETLLGVSIPARITGITMTKNTPRTIQEIEKPDQKPTVLVLLSTNGQMIRSPLAIKPNTLHELKVNARVTSWPRGAVALNVDFARTAVPSVLTMGNCAMTEDSLESDLSLILHSDLADPLVPLNIVTVASFQTKDGDWVSADVIGHPRFCITSFDPATALPLNMPTAAFELQQMVAELNIKKPSLTREDRQNLFVLYESLIRYANRVMQDDLSGLASRLREREFQTDLKKHLAADPNIGARLSEAQGKGGGRTDLGLENIVLELKVENDKEVSLESAHKYISQPSHYAAAGDRQVSILCILDNSPKKAPPATLGNYLGWLFPESHGLLDPTYPSMVAVIIIPIGFPEPSSWS